MTLTEFLLARIAEDEAIAASGEHWRMSSDENVYRAESHATNEPVAVGPWGGDVGDRAAHIARHDPARVLAECKAKRRIVGAMRARHSGYSWFHASQSARGEDLMHGEVCKMLAVPYADHPDYREEWKP